MEVIIHRGTHQIGGCSTEIRTKSTRIFIDFGAELEIKNPNNLEKDLLLGKVIVIEYYLHIIMETILV